MQTKQKHKCLQDLIWDCHCATLKKQTGEAFNTDIISGGKYNTTRLENEGTGEDLSLVCFESICEVWSVLSKFLATADPGVENSSPAKKKRSGEGRMNGGLPKAKNTSGSCSHLYGWENFMHEGERGEKLWKLSENQMKVRKGKQWGGRCWGDVSSCLLYSPSKAERKENKI